MLRLWAWRLFLSIQASYFGEGLPQVPLFSVALSELVAASTAGLFAASPAGLEFEDSTAFSWLLDELSLRLGELTELELELESDLLPPASLLLDTAVGVSLELPPEELQLPVL